MRTSPYSHFITTTLPRLRDTITAHLCFSYSTSLRYYGSKGYELIYSDKRYAIFRDQDYMLLLLHPDFLVKDLVDAISIISSHYNTSDFLRNLVGDFLFSKFEILCHHQRK